jgi:hypothetical protein
MAATNLNVEIIAVHGIEKCPKMAFSGIVAQGRLL